MKNFFLSFMGNTGKTFKQFGNVLERISVTQSNDVFLTPNAIQINEARQKHLASLELDLENKTVLEVGAGIGLHTGFFEERGCEILSSDSRLENLAEIQRRDPHRKVKILDLEKTTDLTHLGEFDIIYCYGLLYHTANPQQVLSSLSQICRQMILLETCVTPGMEIKSYARGEDKRSHNQAMSGLGCRPTRPWIMETLREYYGYAYISKTQPRHIDFDLDWVNAVPKGNHRAVFVGSKMPLKLPTLLDSPPEFQVFDAN